VIKYKNGRTNKLLDFVSRPLAPNIATPEAIIHMDPFTHEPFKHECVEYDDFKGM
jgi:hypothetical protein